MIGELRRGKVYLGAQRLPWTALGVVDSHERVVVRMSTLGALSDMGQEEAKEHLQSPANGRGPYNHVVSIHGEPDFPGIHFKGVVAIIPGLDAIADLQASTGISNNDAHLWVGVARSWHKGNESCSNSSSAAGRCVSACISAARRPTNQQRQGKQYSMCEASEIYALGLASKICHLKLRHPNQPMVQINVLGPLCIRLRHMPAHLSSTVRSQRACSLAQEVGVDMGQEGFQVVNYRKRQRVLAHPA
ncbi:hypothetical protein BDZ88DRAFT_267789 [Geranomyces variabilis]|nr:hypothetical protein BDZ88DRAFT_267789 [Geranomyces variabilis]